MTQVIMCDGCGDEISGDGFSQITVISRAPANVTDDWCGNCTEKARDAVSTGTSLRAYLDHSITTWRVRRASSMTDSKEEMMAACYVDAYQSVRVSMLGEQLP